MTLHEVRLDEDLLSVLARDRTQQSCDDNARVPRVSFLNEALNAVLHYT